MANYKANTFFYEASRDLTKPQDLLSAHFDTKTKPYYNLKHHAASVLYPVAHSIHMLKNLLKIA